MDKSALYKIGYGLYVLTAREGGKDNGCIINTLMQVTGGPPAVCVITVSKLNYTHDMIARTKEFNVSALTAEAPFFVYKHFGYQSGRDLNKFADCKDETRSANGLIYLPKYVNAYMSFRVTDAFDFGTHTMFKAEMADGALLSDAESVTYAYYQKNVKPAPEPARSKGWRCNICGYVYEGDTLPEDFICPLCKHGASDFTKI